VVFIVSTKPPAIDQAQLTDHSRFNGEGAARDDHEHTMTERSIHIHEDDCGMRNLYPVAALPAAAADAPHP
jgi:hypothetical protein